MRRRLSIERLEPRLALVSTALPFVGVEAFQQQQPYPGVGLTVDGSHGPNGQPWSIAVIDTGVDLDHPFFVRNGLVNGIADRIVYQYDFYGGVDSCGFPATARIGRLQCENVFRNVTAA